MILAEVNEPPKSIFNIGQMRHNVMTKEDAQKLTFRNFSTKPVRVLEWNENVAK